MPSYELTEGAAQDLRAVARYALLKQAKTKQVSTSFIHQSAHHSPQTTSWNTLGQAAALARRWKRPPAGIQTSALVPSVWRPK